MSRGENRNTLREATLLLNGLQIGSSCVQASLGLRGQLGLEKVSPWLVRSGKPEDTHWSCGKTEGRQFTKPQSSPRGWFQEGPNPHFDLLKLFVSLVGFTRNSSRLEP